MTSVSFSDNKQESATAAVCPPRRTMKSRDSLARAIAALNGQQVEITLNCPTALAIASQTPFTAPVNLPLCAIIQGFCGGNLVLTNVSIRGGPFTFGGGGPTFTFVLLAALGCSFAPGASTTTVSSLLVPIQSICFIGLVCAANRTAILDQCRPECKTTPAPCCSAPAIRKESKKKRHR